jgi:cytoskeletal protein RodZ
MELAVSFGRELQLERTKREISLASISEHTKVPTRHLSALENGEFHQLPGGVFNKGILRSYCRYLGLSEEDWLPKLAEACPTEPIPEAADLAEFAENLARSRGVRRSRFDARWWGVVAMLLALGAICWGAWRYVVRPQVVPLPVAQAALHAPASMMELRTRGAGVLL